MDLAGVRGPDGSGDLLGLGVLEHVARRAGLERRRDLLLLDELVIATISVSGSSALIRPIAVMPSMFGISRSIRTTSGLSRAGHRHALGAVRGLADDLDVVEQVEEGPQARPDDGVVVHEQDADPEPP